jgi:hypothetical protein
MTTDNGGAPAVWDGVLSLAICKPQIRKSASEGDFVIGVGAKTTIGERLIYVAQVTHKLRRGEYFRDPSYYDRPDCVYRWDGESKSFFWDPEKEYHSDEDIAHDLGLRKNGYPKAQVLMSTRFSYFGSQGTESYKAKYPRVQTLVERLAQGHRVNYSNPRLQELKSLLSEYLEMSSVSTPTEGRKDGRCNGRDDHHTVFSCS